MEQIYESIIHSLLGQGPVVGVLLLGIYHLRKSANDDRVERQKTQENYLKLFTEINDTLNEYTRVIEGLNQGFQIIVNHILHNTNNK